MTSAGKIYLRCAVCAEVFTAKSIRLPMPAEDFAAELKKVTCPECGAGAKSIRMWGSNG